MKRSLEGGEGLVLAKQENEELPEQGIILITCKYEMTDLELKKYGYVWLYLGFQGAHPRLGKRPAWTVPVWTVSFEEHSLSTHGSILNHKRTVINQPSLNIINQQ